MEAFQWFKLIELEFTKQIVSSTCLFHNDISLDNVGIIFYSSSTIKILAKTGPSGDPIATPWICTYVLLFRVKCAFLVQRYNNSFISCFGMLVLISFSSYILLITIIILIIIIIIIIKQHTHKSYCDNVDRIIGTCQLLYELIPW